MKKAFLLSTILYYSSFSFGAQAGTRESHIYGVVMGLIMAQKEAANEMTLYVEELCTYTKSIKSNVDPKSALMKWELDLCVENLSHSVPVCESTFAEFRARFREIITQKCL